MIDWHGKVEQWLFGSMIIFQVWFQGLYRNIYAGTTLLHLKTVFVVRYHRLQEQRVLLDIQSRFHFLEKDHSRDSRRILCCREQITDK